MNSEVGVQVTKVLGATVNPTDVLESMLDYAERWVTEVQQAATQRAGIAAWENVQTQRIHAQGAVLLKALDLTFDERRQNFARLFDGLDSAMAAGDAAQAAAVLESITELAKVSPFEQLANLEIVGADLKRPDQVWDV